MGFESDRVAARRNEEPHVSPAIMQGQWSSENKHVWRRSIASRGDLFNLSKSKTMERRIHPIVKRMRNHGSQHWRKPHGIRYSDYGRNNSLIRAT